MTNISSTIMPSGLAAYPKKKMNAVLYRGWDFGVSLHAVWQEMFIT
jgi:hypothetical protein